MGVINLGILVEKIKRKLIGSGFVTGTDYATASTGGVVKVSGTYGAYVSGAGVLYPAVRTVSQYENDQSTFFISKGTLENVKSDVTGRGLVEIAQAQHPTPTAGTYTVKLTYDGTAWGVTITQDT